MQDPLLPHQAATEPGEGADQTSATWLLAAENTRRTLALYAYSRARDLSPDDPHAFAGLGEVLMKMDSLDAARPYLERACAVLTEDAERWTHLGCVRAALGDYEAAVEPFPLNPNEGYIRRYLGHALCRTGDSEPATPLAAAGSWSSRSVSSRKTPLRARHWLRCSTSMAAVTRHALSMPRAAACRTAIIASRGDD